ncbi:DUF5686 family protein [Owenweeksia hongkongensis]|uniref:DUF5686 family protein n=1 Tax=Owenweeksia hongkongensis TaxID=253245 RepID=UPI003A90822E
MAQPKRIYGSVRDKDGEPISQALLWVSDMDTIFYSDNNGDFNIPILSHKHYLKVTAPGFSSKRIVLPYNHNQPLLIYLEQNITDEYFNPYEVIRLAKNKRAENEEKYTAYTGTAFKSTTANLFNVPFQIPIASGFILPGKGDTGIMFYSEQISKHNFQNEYSFSDSVIAYRAGGNLPVPNFNYVSDKDLSLYHNQLSLPELDYRKYFSPLGDRGLRYYKFSAKGTYMDGNRKVFRISFEPKKYGSATLKGYMELYDSTYTLAFAKFSFDNAHHLKSLDSVAVEQFFVYQNDEYRQVHNHLTHYLHITGFSGNYESNTYFSDYEYQNSNPEIKLGTEVYHLDSLAINGDSNIWKNHAPKPISAQAERVLSSENLNKIFRGKYARNLHFHTEFKPFQLLYKRYIYREDDLYFNLSPLYYMPGFNTVEGAYLTYKVPIKVYKPNTEWSLTPMVRYGFADNEFKSRMTAELTYDLKNPKKVSLEVGHVFDQFNEEDPISPFINTYYSLVLGKNYMKLYGKDYIRAGYQLEIVNGLEFQSSLEYGNRFAVYNNTDYTFFGDGSNFTPNNPTADDVIDENGFKEHHALTFRTQLAYQFHQRYKTINGKKVALQMNTPRVYLNYRQGIKSSFSDTRFAFASAGISFNTDLGNAGHTKWDFSAGGFMDNKYMEFIDYQHFNGTQTFYLQQSAYSYSSIKRFSTLGYYSYSTDQAFIEAHVEHHFDGALLSKISFLRNTGIHAFGGANYLNNFSDPQFLEVAFGIDNIMDILKIEIASSIHNINDVRPTILVGIDFNYLYYVRNKR